MKLLVALPTLFLHVFCSSSPSSGRISPQVYDYLNENCGFKGPYLSRSANWAKETNLHKTNSHAKDFDVKSFRQQHAHAPFKIYLGSKAGEHQWPWAAAVLAGDSERGMNFRFETRDFETQFRHREPLQS